MRYCVLSVAFFWVAATAQNIPTNSFSDFDTYWNYLYPWGSDHNGGARMDTAHVSVEDGVLVLTAEPVTGQSPAQHGGNEIPINYLSGAIHAKEQFTVKAGGGYDFSADFIAPVELGTWPAFWLTGVNSWPPEIDIAEWKGSGDISFNTFNTSSEVDALDVNYPSPSEWHSVKAEIRAVNGADVKTDFYLDGEWVTSQHAASFIYAPLWL
jgi:beta-glucanase (GH16 family)